MAASGAWVTWTGLGTVMLGGAVLGLVLAAVGRLRGRGLTVATAVPFGLPLAFATWLVWLYGPGLS
jgi:prepilin signal peptidase PulO-like enzyme (type II secretory pathway)